jgi:uncharacterized YccA/Bax inhibitor family protein
MYIDPNSGGLIFQALIVIFGVFSASILLFSSKIKMGVAKFRRGIRQKSEDDDSSELNSTSEE